LFSCARTKHHYKPLRFAAVENHAFKYVKREIFPSHMGPRGGIDFHFLQPSARHKLMLGYGFGASASSSVPVC